MNTLAPKCFISYSWTSPEHQAWVLQFATELREHGVDVILDKWDLKEGQDANAFMEKMVSDKAVTKVILLRSEEHTSELQSLTNLVCRLLLEKKKYSNLDGHLHRCR